MVVSLSTGLIHNSCITIRSILLIRLVLKKYKQYVNTLFLEEICEKLKFYKTNNETTDLIRNYVFNAIL